MTSEALICTCGRAVVDSNHADSCPVTKSRARDREKAAERKEGEQREAVKAQRAQIEQAKQTGRDIAIHQMAAACSSTFAAYAIDQIHEAGGNASKAGTIINQATIACVDFAEKMVIQLEARQRQRLQ
jgi:hypothetical protein